MSEGLVCLRHSVDIVLALPRPALLLGRVEDFAGEALRHRVLAAVAGEVDQPAHGERAGAASGDLDRHLVGGAADPARADLERRGQVFDRRLQGLDRVLAGTLADDRQCVVDDPLGDRLLAVAHHLVDQLLDEPVAETGIRFDRADLCGGAARHRSAGLDAVKGACLLAVGDAGRVEGATDDLVADARQILDPAAADQHHRVLLQVVALAGDVGGDLHPVGEANTGDLAQGRVRLLRRYRGDAGADASPLRRGDALLAPLARLEARRRRLLLRPLAALANKLVRVRHGPAWYRPLQTCAWLRPRSAAALTHRKCVRGGGLPASL